MKLNYVLNRAEKQAKIYEISLDDYVNHIKGGIHPKPVKNVDILRNLKLYKKDNLPYASIPITYKDYRGGEVENYNPIFVIDIDFSDGETKSYYLNGDNKGEKKWQAYNTMLNSIFNELDKYKQYTILKRSYNKGIHMLVRYDYTKLSSLDVEQKIANHRKLIKIFTDFVDDIILEQCNSLGYNPIVSVDNVSFIPSQLNIINYDPQIKYQKDFTFFIDDDLVDKLLDGDNTFQFNKDKQTIYTHNEIMKLNAIFIDKLRELYSIYGNNDLFHKKLMEIFSKLEHYSASTYISLKYSNDATINQFYHFIKKIYKGSSMRKNLQNKQVFYDWIKSQATPSYIIPLKDIFSLSKLLYQFTDVMLNDYDDVIDIRDKMYLDNVDNLQKLLDDNKKIIIKGQPGIGKTTFFMKYLIQKMREGNRVAYISPKILILNQIEHDYNYVDFEKYYGGNPIGESNFILASFQQLHKILKQKVDIIVYDEIQNFIEYTEFNEMKINNISNIFDYDRKHILISGTPELFKTIYDFTYVNILSNKTNNINIIPTFRKKLDHILNLIGDKPDGDIIYIYKNNKKEIQKIITEIKKKYKNIKIGQVHNGYESIGDDENDKLSKHISQFNHIPDGYDVIFATDKLNEGVNINNSNIFRVIIDYHNDTNIFKVKQVRNRFRKLLNKNIYDVIVYNYQKKDDDVLVMDMINQYKNELYDEIKHIETDCIRYNLNQKSKKLRIKNGITMDYFYCQSTKEIHANKNYIIKTLYKDLEDELKSSGKIIDYIEMIFNTDWIILKGDDETKRIGSGVKEIRKKLDESFRATDGIYGELYDNILDAFVELFRLDVYDERLDTISEMFNIDGDFLFNNKTEMYRASQRWIMMKNYGADDYMEQDEIIYLTTTPKEKTFTDKLAIMELKWINSLGDDLHKADEKELYDDNTLLQNIVDGCQKHQHYHYKNKTYVLWDDVFTEIQKQKNHFLHKYKELLDINDEKKLRRKMSQIGYKVKSFNQKNKNIKVIYM